MAKSTVHWWLTILVASSLGWWMRFGGWTDNSVRNSSIFPVQFWLRFHPDLDSCNGFYDTKTPDCSKLAIGPVLPCGTRRFNLTTLVPMKYLTFDRIVTWSIRRLSSSRRPSSSRIQSCHPTNIHWVVIESRQISPMISRHFTAVQQILVRSQIWKREVNEQLRLHNLRIQHVMVQSEPKTLNAAKVQPTL